MTREEFDAAIAAFARRQPFRPFAAALLAGTVVRVERPDDLVYRGGTAVHFPAKGEMTIFDHEGLIAVIDAASDSTGAVE